MNRKILLAFSVLFAAAPATSPVFAQTRSHGAGVNWTGGHGGVSWDGGHGYSGGGYGGYPADNPPPYYRAPKPPVTYDRQVNDTYRRTQLTHPSRRPASPRSGSGASDGHAQRRRDY